jgi:hypothetical protein
MTIANSNSSTSARVNYVTGSISASEAKSNLVKAIIIDAVERGLTARHICDHIQNLRSECSVLHVNEVHGFGGLAFTDRVTALYVLFNSLDSSFPIAKYIDETYSVAMISHGGETYYRFSDDMDGGSSCSFDKMIGELYWIEPGWVMVENDQGIFTQRDMM